MARRSPWGRASRCPCASVSWSCPRRASRQARARLSRADCRALAHGGAARRLIRRPLSYLLLFAGALGRGPSGREGGDGRRRRLRLVLLGLLLLAVAADLALG